MFYLVGLGLGDVKDITVKGLEVVKNAERVYLEAYTSILTVGKEALEEYYGRKVILADRDMVEQQSDELLDGADKSDVAFLVVGDPLGATTHTDLILRAVEKGIQYRVVHNASIMNAVGCCGLQTPNLKSTSQNLEHCLITMLQLYNYGEAVSIVFWTDTWRPDSFYDKIAVNRDRGMHTLCLLDIKMKEQTIENLMKGNKIFEPPRFMSVSQAAEQLLEIVQRKGKEGEQNLALSEDTVCVGLARVGCDDQKICVATLQQLTSVDLGEPLHSLVIPGHMHPLEIDMLNLFALDGSVKTHLQACLPSS